MGSKTFSHYQPGTDLHADFQEARENSAYDDGEDFTDKTSVMQVRNTPVSQARAYELVDEYLNGSHAVADTYGPAGAIPVLGGERQVWVEITPRAGGYASVEEAAAESIKAQGLLRDGEKIAYGIQGLTENDARGRVASGQLLVPVEGGTGSEQTGWMFFGWVRD